MTRILNPIRRSPTSCSVLALATAMAFGATPANAQFVGTIDSSAGIDTVNSTNSNLFITGQQAVINWTADGTASGGQIAFLPDGNDVTFSSGSDFAVLNRVTPGTPGSAIYMGGNISSFAGDFTGGTVYFYSPNGIVIGQNASINVGSLGLTTLPIADDGQGNWMTGFGGANPSVTFGQATNPNSYIRTDAAIDGSIRANGAGNYVALVAPIINHAGTIRTDGGAVLVAAEAASITFSDSGLYNIQVTAGSGAAQSLTVNGGRIERNSQTIGGDRHAYLVAVPKNDLTTMLITGGANLGFDIAGSAGVEGNSVVLSSGYMEVNGSGLTYVDGNQGNLTIDNAAFSSDVETIAYGDTQITTYNGPTSFSGNLDITNDFTAFVGATTEDLTIGGDLDVHTFYIWSLFGQPTVSLWAGAGATLSAGNVELLANTHGANSPDEFSPGESVTGGTINITANDGGHVLVNGSLYGEANGTGGAQDYSGGVGGDGTGGTINVSALGAGSSIAAGTSELYAYGYGGSTSECLSCDIGGGIGHGGTISVKLDQGAASITTGALNTWAIGQGGYGAGGNGGDGIGGTSTLSIGGGSTLSVNGNYFNFADGNGGGAEGAGNAGDGHGGTASLTSTAGAGQIFFRGADAYITADAIGGVASGSGDGGNAFTGSATLNITNTTITVANPQQAQPFGRLYVKSDAYGGTSTGGAGGSADATTGPVSITLGAGSSLTAGQQIVTEARATGGNGVSGGAARGGTATITVNSGGALTGNVNQLADATAGTGTSGPGGNATAGTVALNVTGGTATLANYLADASANGGNSTGGAGGNATGGRTTVSAVGGTLHVTGNLSVDSGAIGGNGLSGGNAAGLVSPPENEGSPVAAGLYVQNGGSLDVDGLTTISTAAVGGNASNGTGGNAVAGETDVVVFTGAMNLNSLSVDANAHGGNGAGGGNGGNAFGGPVDVAFGLNAAPILGTITLGSATITADGEGGNGGAGTNGTAGGNGGAGGDGTGGRIIFAGSAAGGTLNSGLATITALGTGGTGGAGGTGSAGTGGNGGVGGIGTGGNIQTGTISNENSPNSGGGATYATMSLDSSGTGGDGGAGGIGSSGNGAGGNGGAAQGGNATFLARGVLVTADTVTLAADATGGDGGSGSVEGNGGNARTGTIQVEAKDRFGHADERGFLDANSITGTAVATGGTGATDGTGSVTGNSYFRLLNGDADIGSFSFNTAGDIYDNSFVNSTVSVRDGTAALGDFTFTTTGELALDASNGSMTASTITLSAGTFIPDAFSGAQAGPGTYSADAFDISTGGDFITNAHLISTGSLDIIAPGLIDMRDATSGGDLTLQAGSTINGTTQAAAGSVFAGATGDITLSNVIAGNLIDIFSETGGLSLGFLSAGTSIDLDAAGNIGFGDVTADDLDFSAGGDVDGGDILAATQASGEAQGAITLGDISVGIQAEGGAAEDGFAVGMSSATSINVGDVEADESIGFATFGPLTSGDLNAGGNIMALASGDMSLGAMTTGGSGQVYLADSSMFIDAGGPDDFVPSLVLNADPVPTSGSITINGPVSTSLFRAAAGINFTAGDITAQQIVASAGGLATVNGTWSAQFVSLTSGDIDIGASGAIEGDSESSVVLHSTNGEGALIGDGLSGSGYRLTNAEFGRISAGELTIIVGGAPGAAADTLLGDLDITGPTAGSTIESSTGGVTFVTLDEAGEGLDGTLRIVGEVNATGFGDDNYLSFETQHFELDAATGLLNIEGAPGTLGGQLWITAQNVHVASGDILDQLAEDPQYDGYQEDLNAPAAVQRPDGVIRARTMELEFFGGSENQPNTLYVQNTGTSEVPAGFVISGIGLDGDGEGGLPPNSLDVVINGQIVTEGGTLTGIDVRDALVESEGDLTPFTANSTVNGCLLTGACSEPQGPFPPNFTPTPDIQQEIVLLGNDDTPPPPFGNEDVIDDNDEETEDTSPIVPPQPLFDTSELGEADSPVNPKFGTPMRSSPGIKEEGDVDDPVSGSGNPGLMETPPPPAGQQETQP